MAIPGTTYILANQDHPSERYRSIHRIVHIGARERSEVGASRRDRRLTPPIRLR